MILKMEHDSNGLHTLAPSMHTCTGLVRRSVQLKGNPRCQSGRVCEMGAAEHPVQSKASPHRTLTGPSFAGWTGRTHSSGPPWHPVSIQWTPSPGHDPSGASSGLQIKPDRPGTCPNAVRTGSPRRVVSGHHAGSIRFECLGSGSFLAMNGLFYGTHMIKHGHP